MSIDTPLVLYMAWLMNEHHAVPYRDFFEANTPGAFFFYQFYSRFLGYGDLAARVADLLTLAMIMGLTWLWLRRFGWRTAWCGIVLFGLSFLKGGIYLCLQREFLAILPISAALAITLSFPRMNLAARSIITGLLFGFCAIIRPHAVIGLPPILIFQACQEAQVRSVSFWRRSLPVALPAAGLGFAVPIGWFLFYLHRNGGLDSFLEIIRCYWPIYCQLTGGLQTSAGMSRLEYLHRTVLQFGFHSLWFLPATVGAFTALYHSRLDLRTRNAVWLLVSLAVAYCLYTLGGGKFWAYHWLLFLYFILMLSSLCLVESSDDQPPVDQRFPVFALVLVILLSSIPPPTFFKQIFGEPFNDPRIKRVDEMADYLSVHLQEGDTVQPLDTAGGALHAMLIARARIATPFLYDFHFYHHVSNDYIQKLRSRFISSLHAAQPRLIVEVEEKARVSGPDTTNEFPELRALLKEHYNPVFMGKGYCIYERNRDWKKNDEIISSLPGPVSSGS